jgi:predicted nucleic acid-binding protein
MSGRKLLIDSNIVIYLAKKQLLPEAFLRNDDVLFISDVTFMETLGYAFADATEMQETQNLVSILIRTPIEEAIVQKVLALRQNHRIKLPDAIIAATALVHDYILVTRDISDFSRIPGMALLNPFENEVV